MPQKPSFPQLNRSHPLAQGLVFDMPLFEGAGNSLLETVNNRNGGFAGTANPVWSKTAYGNSLNFNTATQAAYVPLVPAQSQNSVVTFEAIFSRRSGGSSGASYGVITELGTFGGAGSYAIYNDNGSGGWGLVFSPPFSTTAGHFSIPYPNANLNHLVITFNGGSTANVPKIYLNKILQPVTVRITPSGTCNPSGNRATFGTNRNLSAGNAWDGEITYFREWNRILSEADVASLYADPFQIYRKKSWFIRAQAAASSGWSIFDGCFTS